MKSVTRTRFLENYTHTAYRQGGITHRPFLRTSLRAEIPVSGGVIIKVQPTGVVPFFIAGLILLKFLYDGYN